MRLRCALALPCAALAALACAGIPPKGEPPAPAPQAPGPAAPAQQPPAEGPPCILPRLPAGAPAWTGVLAALDEGGAIPSTENTFSRFVSDEVVKEGVTFAVSYLEGDWERQEPFYSDDLASSARHAAYLALEPQCVGQMTEEGTCSEYNPLLFHDTPSAWLWRRSVVEEAKRHLSDPRRLWATWERHREAVVDAIPSERAENVHRWLTEEVLPALREPIRSDLCAALQRESEVWNDLAMKEPDDAPQQQQWRERHAAAAKLTGRRLSILQFRLRRQREGGTALVETWIRIADDLAARLEGP